MSNNCIRPAAPRKEPREVHAVDASTLGRPVQLLTRYTDQLGDVLGEMFKQISRRYRAAYQVSELSISPSMPPAANGRWMVGDTEQGRVGGLIERSLVLSLMAHRYGAADAAPADAAPAASSDAMPETSTEERLRRSLCLQALERALRLIESAPAAVPELPRLQLSQQAQLVAGTWFIQATISEVNQGLSSRLLLALSPQHIARLLQRLSQELPARAEAAAPKPEPAKLVRQLQLKIEARLLEQQIPLGQLLDLRPGDLIPIRLKTTDVLIDGSRLFTASVAEHQGKLCLTSFADAD